MVAQPGQRPDHKVARQHVANQTMAIYEFELPQVRDVMSGRVAAKKRRASFQPLGWVRHPTAHATQVVVFSALTDTTHKYSTFR